MRISFDLDDTLIISDKGSKYEEITLLWRKFFYKEKLRYGIKKLCKDLINLGYEICVYTTSNRSVNYIKRLFRLYGVKITIVINLEVHENIVQRNRKEIMPSKVPSKFGIDLHIDDDISVKQNGIQYGFNVLIIRKNDDNWCEKVISEAIRIKKLKSYNKIN